MFSEVKRVECEDKNYSREIKINSQMKTCMKLSVGIRVSYQVMDFRCYDIVMYWTHVCFSFSFQKPVSYTAGVALNSSQPREFHMPRRGHISKNWRVL